MWCTCIQWNNYLIFRFNRLGIADKSKCEVALTRTQWNLETAATVLLDSWDWCYITVIILISVP